MAASDTLIQHIPSLNARAARQAIDLAIAEAERRGFRLTIAVTDAAGMLLALHRMDGAPLPTIAAASEKAKTSARLRATTMAFQEIVDTRHISYLSLPDFMPLGGGVPVQKDGITLGAIATSGAEAHEDAEVAQVAVDTLLRLIA